MSEISLERRSTPDRLRYLAGKLSDGDQNRVAVMIALSVIADEMEAAPKPQPAYITALMECSDEDLRDALIHIGPDKRRRLRELLTGGR